MPKETRIYMINGTRGAMALMSAGRPDDATDVEYEGAPEIVKAAPVIQNRRYSYALPTVENWAREQGFVVTTETKGEWDGPEMDNDLTPAEPEA